MSLCMIQVSRLLGLREVLLACGCDGVCTVIPSCSPVIHIELYRVKKKMTHIRPSICCFGTECFGAEDQYSSICDSGRR